MKKVLSILLVILMLLTFVPFTFAEDVTIVNSGTCGDNLIWMLYSDNTLTISGTGSMNDYNQTSYYGTPMATTPWRHYSGQIKVVIIGDSVTSIGSSAFYNCYSLTSVTIPDSVTSIGRYAFCECRRLTSVTIPDSVTSIAYRAFFGCTSLTSVTIPDSVTSIDIDAFKGCSSLTSFTVSEANPAYSTDDSGCLYNKDKTSLIQYPIGNTRTSFSIPNSVTSIGSSAFYNCSNLTSVTIPDSVTSIGKYAFQGCNSLTNLTIPDSVTSIDTDAFRDCYRLTSVTIGNSVTSIGKYAFQYCSQLTDVYYSGSTEDWADISIDSYNDPLINAAKHFNHVHEITDIISLQLATCTEPGKKVGICVCGYSMTIELPAAHTPGDAVIQNEVAATCKAKGSYDEVVYCTECGDELTRTPHETEMLRHVNAEPVKENEIAPSCTAEGSYDSVTYCSKCGDELNRETVNVKMLDHIPGDPTEETVHTATCTTVGEKKIIVRCTECKNVIFERTEEIPALHHSYVTTLTPATCTAAGYTTYSCERGDHSYVSDFTDILQHTDADNDGHCDRCNEQMTGGNHCKYCGQIHGGAFGWLVKIFHSIFALFKR